MEKNEYQKIILDILGTRPILFNPDLARALGSVTAGLFLSQLLYWWGKGINPEMVYKTVKEFEEETVLTKHQQLSAQKICIKKGVLSVLYKGIPPKRHFKIDLDKTFSLLEKSFEIKEKNMTTKCLESGHSSVEEASEDMFEIPTHITESTSKNTSESNIGNASVAGLTINRFIKLFKDVNPSYEILIPNKTQRAVSERLILKYGLEDMSKIVGMLSETNGEKYFPIITTPFQLERKLVNLNRAFGWKKQKMKSKTTVLSNTVKTQNENPRYRYEYNKKTKSMKEVRIV